MSTKAKWYSIRQKTVMAAAAMGALAAAEILIYGDIGESYWEETISAKNFVAEIAALDVTQITVRINSIGGSVPDGLAIYNAIRRHPAQVTTEVDGMALSVASLIAMAGDRRCMAANAMLMIHAPWTYMAGNSAELREKADELDSWASAAANSYAEATGRPHAEMLTLMQDGKDHYYTADEALTEKFIDSISDSVPPAALGSAARDFGVNARYRDVPSAWLKALGDKSAPASAAASSVVNTTQTQEETEMKLGKSLIALAVLAAAGSEGTVVHGTGTGVTPPVNTGPVEPTAAQRTAILSANATRMAAIELAAKPFMSYNGMADLVVTMRADHDLTPEAAGLQILAHVGKNASSVSGTTFVKVEDEADKIRAAGVEVLMARSGIMGADRKPFVAASGNPFRGMTLLDMARDSLVRAGVRTQGLDKMPLVAMAFTNSSSDFPILLENTMHKTLQAAYAMQPFTWNRWAKTGTVSDFRAHKRYRKGSFGNLDTVNEAGEYKTKQMPDGEKAQITAGTKGNLVNLTRVAIINDDLDAFLGIATDLGQAAARSVETDAIAVLVANGALVQDGITLFHANHGNLGVSAVGSVASFDEARVLMAKQTNVGANDYLDLRPAIWLGPTGLGANAKVVNAAEYDPDTPNKLQRPNAVRGMFSEVIDTPRLTGTAWYALADKDICPTVEVAFLDGNQVPYLEIEQGFSVDGAQWKVRLDYGVAAVDFRGAVKNAGA